MALRRPLVQDAGSIKELPAGDAVAGIPLYVRAYQQSSVALKLTLMVAYGLPIKKANGTALNAAVALNG